VDVSLGYGVTLSRQVLRLQGFDAWETSYVRRTVAVTADEIRMGKLARDEFVRMLTAAKSVVLVPGTRQRDTYGRLLGHVLIDGKDAGDALTAGGHARSQ
jgi:endonuclease YncB( thermonuclease family)